MGPEVRRLADAGPSLLEFWKRYKRLYPNHEVFKLVAENALKLEECVPCYMHGDEGTTYKKDGCLCLSFHCAMGRGTISNKMGPITHEVLDDPHLNFVGHAFETRFLLSAMLREDYRDDHSVMSDLLEVVVGSLDHASRNGVPLASGGKLHPVCLGNKGDWPYLEEAVFTRKLMHEFDKKAAFHKVDIFHTVSLGVGKAWAACGFAILQQVCPGTSIEKRLQVLSDLYVEYCVDPQPLIDAIFHRALLDAGAALVDASQPEGVRGKLQLMAESGVPGEVSKTRVEKAYPFDPVKARADL
ncbi:unnamed protein product [Durusdinium trenchii]|uniref:Uncharacterized protein n=1 Tax=Durusdinium trenchii TaxID=1381693 RepID=A0ABP0N0J4_9DINO